MTELHAYLNDPQLKADFIAQIADHERQDAIIKGTYGAMNGRFRGCAIGCALHSLNVLQGKSPTDRVDEHCRYEKELGLPAWFAYLEDHIFESLPLDLAKTWPRRIAEALPVGAVVGDVVLAKILRWSLADDTFGVRYATTDNEEVRGYIDAVIAGFDAEISTEGNATADQREAAAWAARAARAAWDAWDARAAWDAWDAWDARDAWDVSKLGIVRAYRDKILEIIAGG